MPEFQVLGHLHRLGTFLGDSPSIKVCNSSLNGCCEVQGGAMFKIHSLLMYGHYETMMASEGEQIINCWQEREHVGHD